MGHISFEAHVLEGELLLGNDNVIGRRNRKVKDEEGACCRRSRAISLPTRAAPGRLLLCPAALQRRRRRPLILLGRLVLRAPLLLADTLHRNTTPLFTRPLQIISNCFKSSQLF